MKQRWKPGTLLYPLPAVMVSCGNAPENYNIITVSWTGTICSDPPMCYISVRKERHSYDILKETGEFVINLSTERLAYATDWCGVCSGRNENKFEKMRLTPEKGVVVDAPLIAESPLNIECRVKEILPLGSHDMFIADVVNIMADAEYIDKNTGKFHLEKTKLLTYVHGEYFGLGRKLGYFGWSVRKKRK